jgi:hypothetical protein
LTLSKVCYLFLFGERSSDLTVHHLVVNLVDPKSGKGLGQLDFFATVDRVTIEFLEKWWCLGDPSNRSAVWIQGKKVL